MIYRIHLLRFFFATDDHLFRIKEAEEIRNLRKVTIILLFASLFVYLTSAYLGIGSNYLSTQSLSLTGEEYEVAKLWFLLGRSLYSLIFAITILFGVSLLFYLLTDIPYKKLVIMQQIVLLVMLIERIIWIGFAVFAGLDWYVSPFSFGIIASYLTEKQSLIFFFGAISLFQLWIIWFQIKYLLALSETKKHVIIGNVLFIHFLGWMIASFTATMDMLLLDRWFNV